MGCMKREKGGQASMFQGLFMQPEVLSSIWLAKALLIPT